MSINIDDNVHDDTEGVPRRTPECCMYLVRSSLSRALHAYRCGVKGHSYFCTGQSQASLKACPSRKVVVLSARWILFVLHKSSMLRSARFSQKKSCSPQKPGISSFGALPGSEGVHRGAELRPIAATSAPPWLGNGLAVACNHLGEECGKGRKLTCE